MEGSNLGAPKKIDAGDEQTANPYGGDSEKFYGGLEADIPGPVSKLDGQSQHFAK